MKLWNILYWLRISRIVSIDGLSFTVTDDRSEQELQIRCMYRARSPGSVHFRLSAPFTADSEPAGNTVHTAIETLHERIAQIFRHLLFQGSCDIMAGIGSRACRLHVPARISRLPQEIPELYAKPYSLTVNFQSLHFYFSCMHSARMLRSVGKYNTDCAILSCNVSI